MPSTLDNSMILAWFLEWCPFLSSLAPKALHHDGCWPCSNSRNGNLRHQTLLGTPMSRQRHPRERAEEVSLPVHLPLLLSGDVAAWRSARTLNQQTNKLEGNPNAPGASSQQTELRARLFGQVGCTLAGQPAGTLTKVVDEVAENLHSHESNVDSVGRRDLFTLLVNHFTAEAQYEISGFEKRFMVRHSPIMLVKPWMFFERPRASVARGGAVTVERTTELEGGVLKAISTTFRAE
ncbi:unnamed protein product [Fusarium venenatum]|uniref:Uncharacterized protein n=1 Tax=Fusarium venenatum TaxID=56646 RepID=A0A2L2TRX0_9HYPO|nr:uncharacterized protein FVRRES_02968 [Fusarium venenatum]CEI66456.1 unnamed protein product [Fusarium venenatum]